MREARHSMAKLQGATPPPWRGRSRRRLLADVIGGLRDNWNKLAHTLVLLTAYLRPALVRRRLVRLRALGHIEVIPTLAQLLYAGRDQMIVGATEETRLFYREQDIPWVFHNLRRFISGPATMLDPIGLFAPRDAIVAHVLQTFHRHPVYDLVLLRAHDGGVEEMARQAGQLLAGSHRQQRALTSLVEDGAYHARLPGEIEAFIAEPRGPARAIPPGLVDDPALMLAMDQFKDVGGFTRYAARLRVGIVRALIAWLVVGFDQTLGALCGVKLGPRAVDPRACDPEIVARHLPRQDGPPPAARG